MKKLNNKKLNSRIGYYPKDWIVTKFGEIASVTKLAGFEFTEHITYLENGEIIALRALNLKKGKLDLSDVKYIDKSVSDNLIRSKLFKNDIVFSYVGTIGEVAIIEEDNKYHLAPNVAKIVVNKENDAKYMTYYLISEYAHKEIKRLLTTSSQPALSMGNIREIQVPIPPLLEQRKIANILSTWDKAIELKEKLIKQKKEQKKGLMQKLLTGEVRLPGYSGEWKKVKLGEILKERKETGYTELELLAITSSKGVVKRTEVDIKDNSSEDKSKYKRILPNDIGYNTMRMWQGVSGVSKYEGIVSPAYTILKPTNKVNSNFIGYLFKLPKIINLFRRYSQGLVSDTLNLKYENLKGIKVTIPQDVEEQKKIAEILLSIDNEIEMLQEYVNYLKQQKKGLMQLLLTGKVRVKV